MIVWLLILAIVLLSFSAFFAAFLTVWYTTSFKVATLAKTTSMVIGIIGIVMLFIATDWWWGLAGIVGYQILLSISRVIWYNRYAKLLARGENPYSTGRSSKNNQDSGAL